ncbi:hypothetical protein BC939DRAFT_470806 [Gamsiella multidivaricata]|uniref:uncharacterized protein n=1 Tax=Gamsiella multidivaricata TaxID=101098 RepID=UPI0022201F72|nr:uncharacterized protein BC939DRAFT_470806 [Gamsiella multidivaricata]KAG0369173.1 hypothetical protein BGZ54_000163 [Gamsiella multidivaricata]KAI7815986.1 hypothetical protein BC939DRAFT_470806 [Gamsiella multidivaricata]
MLSVSTTFGLANTSPNGISNSDDAQLDLSVSKEGADIPSNSTLAVSSVPVHDTKNVTVNTAVFSAQGHTPSGGLSEEELLLHLHVQRKRLATRKTLAARLLTAQHTPSVEAVYEAAKDELDDVNRRIESLVESHKALATRERPQLAALIKTIEGNDPTAKGIEYQKPLEITKDMSMFQTGSDPRQFLDELECTVCAVVGEQVFANLCGRYLMVFTGKPDVLRLLMEELNKRVNEKLSWDTCQTIFLRITLTDSERCRRINELLSTGRFSNESCRQYGLRIGRELRIHGCPDDDLNILAILKSTVPPMALLNMTTHLILQRRKMGFTSLKEFTEILSGLDGPAADTVTSINGTAGPMCLPTSPTSPASPTLNTGPTHRHLNQGRNRYSPTNNRTGNNGQEAMKPTHRKVPPYNCDRCGKNYTHNSTDCKQCTKCMKMGHFAEDCRIPRKANNQKNQGSGPFSKPQHSG